MKIRNVIVSLDTVLALLVTLITAFFLPDLLMASFCASFYSMGVTVLSIIFSLFFASLAIIMASPDNDFIAFLEEDKHYTALMATFKITLVMLFVSLAYSIVLYVYSDYWVKIDENSKQYKLWFLVFVFFFTYSMMAAVLSVKDTIMFSVFRTKFININNENNDKKA